MGLTGTIAVAAVVAGYTAEQIKKSQDAYKTQAEAVRAEQSKLIQTQKDQAASEQIRAHNQVEQTVTASQQAVKRSGANDSTILSGPRGVESSGVQSPQPQSGKTLLGQ